MDGQDRVKIKTKNLWIAAQNPAAMTGEACLAPTMDN